MRENQKDEDSLPPYPVLDGILHGLVEKEMRIADIVAEGYDPETVRKIERLLYLAEYKRRQSAPGVKVGPKNFGRDRRYPIVNRFRDSGPPSAEPDASIAPRGVGGDERAVRGVAADAGFRTAAARSRRVHGCQPGARLTSTRGASDQTRGEADMARIERIELRLIDIPPKVKRTDAIQSFDLQETPMVRITDADGATGTGYSYTIGTGGSSVRRLLDDHLAPLLIGREAEAIEAIWQDLFYRVHATTVGAMTSIALAAIDTALWDLRARRAGLPLHRLAGGAKSAIDLYMTEGGWLHIEEHALVEHALAASERGIQGHENQDRPPACCRGLSAGSPPCARR